jgi:hypothetical protein
MFNLITYLFILTTSYFLIIYGIIFLLRKTALGPEKRILAGFLIFASVTGLAITLVWPLETIAIINVYTMLFGDWIYQISINYLGNPRSTQAHYSIPWLLRIPPAYMLASIILWGLIGLVIQSIFNKYYMQQDPN